jgi:GWxTD domain-containing protein
MKLRALVVTLLAAAAIFAVAAFANDPAVAVGQARQALQAKDYQTALDLLQGAIPDAAVLPEPKRTQAFGAIHFFTAQAFFGMGNEAKTREELDRFFVFSPQTNSIDAKKYDAGFVALFNDVVKTRKVTVSEGFQMSYPGYRSYGEIEVPERPVAQWGDGPELSYFGSADEKQSWKTLQDDVARRAFIDEFWKRRDQSPETPENERRDDLARRIAFADRTFVTETQRGSMTDRGRVFVLFGPPMIVRHAPLTARDAGNVTRQGSVAPVNQTSSAAGWQAMEMSDRNRAVVSNTPTANAKVERWVYGRDQLPKGFPDDQLAFRFITQEGYGEAVLERDPLVNKAVLDAMRPR